MPVYGGDDVVLFRKALISVFENTLQPNVFLLVVDGPLGCGLDTVIFEFVSIYPHFRVHRLPVNKGIVCALNSGLLLLSDKYIFRADADDINLPTRFETQLKVLRQGYDLVGGAIIEFDKSGKVLGRRSVPIDEENIIKYCARRNPFNHMTVAFDRQKVIDCGGYPSIHFKEDYGLWATMLCRRLRVVNVIDVLVHVTAGADMYKRRGGLKYAVAEMQLQRHLYHCGLKSLLRALWDGILRSCVFLAPQGVRAFIYQKYLRSH